MSVGIYLTSLLNDYLSDTIISTLLVLKSQSLYHKLYSKLEARTAYCGGTVALACKDLQREQGQVSYRKQCPGGFPAQDGRAQRGNLAHQEPGAAQGRPRMETARRRRTDKPSRRLQGAPPGPSMGFGCSEMGVGQCFFS